MITIQPKKNHIFFLKKGPKDPKGPEKGPIRLGWAWQKVTHGKAWAGPGLIKFSKLEAGRLMMEPDARRTLHVFIPVAALPTLAAAVRALVGHETSEAEAMFRRLRRAATVHPRLL